MCTCNYRQLIMYQPVFESNWLLKEQPDTCDLNLSFTHDLIVSFKHRIYEGSIRPIVPSNKLSSQVLNAHLRIVTRHSIPGIVDVV